ncbi:unnamed protein product [Schistosoma turkestanicum]|nr:unnamed protein product [Schistosoma turkestanicum]
MEFTTTTATTTTAAEQQEDINHQHPSDDSPVVRTTKIADKKLYPTVTDENVELQKSMLNNYVDKNTLFFNKFKRERRLTEKLSKGIGYHLGRRRRLLESRRRMADFALAFSIFGILVAFLDIEFISRSLYHKVSWDNIVFFPYYRCPSS